MLIRALRLTDKLTNALLRLVVWSGETLAHQLYQVRIGAINAIVGAWFILSGAFRSGRTVYASTAERRRALMARRAEELSARRLLREDPLKSQNRSLSLFTVVLLALLIVLVLWTTSAAQNNRLNAPRAAGGPLPIEPTRPSPTPTPTLTPTATLVPDPLRATGSIVYSMRENGRDNLWVYGIGQPAPIRLTNTPADDRDPAWSPDGTKIAFASRRDGSWDLYTLELATGQVTRLTFSLDYEASPTWSPDGKFIAYEGYVGGNLDIYIIPSDGKGEPQRVTKNPAPDFAPAWNPGGSPPGRQIAYVSLRDGNAEIYVISLDRPLEDEALRVTATPDIDEDYPAWNPEGTLLAYSALSNRRELVYTKLIANPAAAPVTIAQGRQPAWAPNGTSVITALDTPDGGTQFVGSGVAGALSALAFSVPRRASHPSWTAASLPPALIASGGVKANDEPPLYVENTEPRRDNPPFYQPRVLAGVRAPIAALSDRVDDSFIALRQAVLGRTGYDFLGLLQDALWTTDRLPEPGQTRQGNWMYTGRAFAFVRELVLNDPPPVEVVREDLEAGTFWRVYIRVEEGSQSGRLGEPLKRVPWDVASRQSGDPQAFEQGGRRKIAVPGGYYVDFTQLAEDYGWKRVPATVNWRTNFGEMLYWMFVKTDGLAWREAMLEIYAVGEVEAFEFGPTPIPTRAPTESATPGPRRTPTPVPPDQTGP